MLGESQAGFVRLMLPRQSFVGQPDNKDVVSGQSLRSPESHDLDCGSFGRLLTHGFSGGNSVPQASRDEREVRILIDKPEALDAKSFEVCTGKVRPVSLIVDPPIRAEDLLKDVNCGATKVDRVSQVEQASQPFDKVVAALAAERGGGLIPEALNRSK